MYYTTKDYENNIDLCKCAMYRLAEIIAKPEYEEVKNFLDTTDKDFDDVCDELAINRDECQKIDGHIYALYKYKDITGVVEYYPKAKVWFVNFEVEVIFPVEFNLPPIQDVKMYKH